LLKTGLSFKGKKTDEGWVGIITYYGLDTIFILFMGMLIHSSFMYEDKKLQRDSKKLGF
jgi:hypothetical protein